MARGRAGACFLGLLLAIPIIPAAAETASFGALTVTGDGWDLVPLQSPLNYTSELFQAMGDSQGDGRDDLLLWQTAFPGRALAPGNASGFQGPYGDSGGVCIPESCGPMRDAGNPFARDTRPAHVDLNGDGRDEAVINMASVCSPGSCDPLSIYSSNGSAGRSYAVPESLSGPVTWAYLIGPPWAGVDGALLVEHVEPRSANGTQPAAVTFRIIGYKGMVAEGVSFQWNMSEPTPLFPGPNLPRFLAAPDFDGDGLVDIVLWQPQPLGVGTGAAPLLLVYNGSSLRTAGYKPELLSLAAPDVLIGDFDGDGHDDIAAYQVTNVMNGNATEPYISVVPYRWNGHNFTQDASLQLRGPSIFMSQPSPRVQAGDINGDGKADFVVAKPDTTSSTTGHVLVDVYLGIFWCFAPLRCDRDPTMNPTYSTEISLSGSDIYASANGVRVNLQGDFDGDGRRDIVIGYYGSNAPERGRTSSSGFVAVMESTVLLRKIYPIWIDTDPGYEVHPAYRNYTVHLDHWPALVDTPTLRVNITGLSPGLFMDLQQAGPVATSSDPSLLAIDGIPTFGHVDESSGRFWTAEIPVRFNWSLPADVWFGLEARFYNSSVDEKAFSGRAAKFSPGVAIVGEPRGEYGGRTVTTDGWARAGVPLNVSNLSLNFWGPGAIPVPPSEFMWDISSLYTGDRFLGMNPLADTWATPASTTRNVSYHLSILGAPANYLRETRAFNLSFDGDAPEFGDHYPLDTAWITSSPAVAAVQVFDNASGPDLTAVEFSWATGGGPPTQWYRAEVVPGETAQEAVARASIQFPEGDLSSVTWRATDRVGNGPVQSAAFAVKVDLSNLTFVNPAPAADEWQQQANISASIWIVPGPSGVNSSSVEYRVSSTGLFGFGAWQGYCTPAPPPPATLCYIRIQPPGQAQGYSQDIGPLAEGNNNWIQWRAASNASTEPRYSDPYQIRVDTTPPVFEWIRPNGTDLLPLAQIIVGAGLRDGNDASVAQQGINTSEGATTFRLRAEGQANFSAPLPLHLESSTTDAYRASFEAIVGLPRGNLTIQISATENGGRIVTAETNVRINQLPVVVPASQPPGLAVVVNGTITVHANATDADGQELRYLWSFCGPRADPLSRNESVTFNVASAAPASTATIHTFELCLSVSDGLDGIVLQRMNISVTAVPPPTPREQPPNIAGVGLDVAIFAMIIVAVAALLAVMLFMRRRRLPPPENL